MIMLVEQEKCMCRPSGRPTETVYSCLHVKVRCSYKKGKKRLAGIRKYGGLKIHIIFIIP